MIEKCRKELLELAGTQGFLTYDDIIALANSYSLSISDIDTVSESIQLYGVIIYETVPDKKQKSTNLSEEETDYSRTDYELLYSKIIEKAPRLMQLIENIKTCPVPQKREVGMLVNQVTAGNTFARKRLITLYMRNVLKIAYTMTKQYEYELEDAISAGFLGLISAADKFDPTGFSSFHSYASMWIRQSIQRECNPYWEEYYLPNHAKQKLLMVLTRYNNGFEGQEISEKRYWDFVRHIAAELEMHERETDYWLRSIRAQKCLRTDLFGLEYLICSKNVPPSALTSSDAAYSSILQKDLRDELEQILSQLSERELAVIKMRMGFDGLKVMTLEEIGNELGVTRERVRQIEARAMGKLAHPTNKRKLASFFEVV